MQSAIEQQYQLYERQLVNLLQEQCDISPTSSMSSSVASSSPPGNYLLGYSPVQSRNAVDFNLIFEEDEIIVPKPTDSLSSDLDRWLLVFESTARRTVSLDRNIWLQFLRRMKVWRQHQLEADLELCVFCRNNNEPYSMYVSHKIRDASGRVTCPVLRRYTCPVCGVSGDLAHTIKYCPRVISSIDSVHGSKKCRNNSKSTVPRRKTGNNWFC